MSDKEKLEAYLGYKLKNIRVHNKVLTISVNILFLAINLVLAIIKANAPLKYLLFIFSALHFSIVIFVLINKEKGKLYGKMLSLILDVASCEYLMMFSVEIRDLYIYYWILGVQICIGIISYFIMKKIYINKMLSNISGYEVKEELSDSELRWKAFWYGMGVTGFFKIVKHFSAMLPFWICIVACLLSSVYGAYMIAKLNYIYNNGYMYVVEQAEENYYGAKEVAEQKRKEEKLEELRQNKWKY